MKLPIEKSINFNSAFWDAGKWNEEGKPKVNTKQLMLGIEIEYEHTTDKAIAQRIAQDHLAEIPDYYTRLIKMEKEAKLNK